MSNIAHEGNDAVATEAVLRESAVALRSLAAEHGITELRIAGPGRLVGHIGEDRDLFDVAAFETSAGDVLGAGVEMYSDGVLDHDNVSPDLLAATPL